MNSEPNEDQNDLRRLLWPQTIAILGLSRDPSKHGRRVLDSLRRIGYEGTVWGINPSRPQVASVEVFEGLTDLPEAPDVLAVAVPAPAAIESVTQAAEMGAGAAILFGGGFAESGTQGTKLQSALASQAGGGLRLLGPNSAGLIHAHARTAISFLSCLERPRAELRGGPVGLISQSGGIASYINNRAMELGKGLAVTISTGNEADIDLAVAIRALVEHPDVQVIALVIETIRNGREFIRAATLANNAGKPIFAMRIGRTPAGSQIAQSHTGALATDSNLLDGVLESLEIEQVDSPATLFEAADAAARIAHRPDRTVGVVTHSGGTAAMLADAMSASRLATPPLPSSLRDKLGSVIDFGALGNPADLGGIVANPGRFAEAIGHFAESKAFGLVLAVSTPHPPSHTSVRAEKILEIREPTQTPIVHLWLAGDQAEEGLRSISDRGLSVTTSISAAISTLRGVSRPAVEIQQADRDLEPGWLSGSASHRDLDLIESRALVAEAGIPVMPGKVVTNLDEALTHGLEFPLALKASVKGVAHKSDIGAVALDIRNESELRDAWVSVGDAVLQASGGQQSRFLIEEFRPGLEIILGGVRDPSFGPVVLLGLGGVLAEAISDVSLRLAPVSTAQATNMVSSLRGVGLFDGFRHLPPADKTALIDRVVGLSHFLADDPDIVEIEVNPLIFTGSTWVAADAFARVSGPADPGSDSIARP